VLYLQEDRIIWVALLGPKEAFKAILAMTRDQMNVQMWYALTDSVIDGSVRTQKRAWHEDDVWGMLMGTTI
jgi:hypothetical protein